MKKPAFICTVVFLVVVVSLSKLTKSPQVSGSSLPIVQPGMQRATLANAEERDLDRFVPQTLSWIAKWTQPRNCLVDGEIHNLDFAKDYDKHEGQEIEMGVEIHERSVVVYFDALHASLSFARLYDSGLSPAEITLFCKDSYKKYRAEVLQLQEMNRPQYEEVGAEQRLRNPASADVIDRARHPPAPKDEVVTEEVRRFRLPHLMDSPPEEAAHWDKDKKVLYDRVLEVLQDQARFGCTEGRVKATIPDFNVGDPSIYILMNGPFYGGGDYVEWINFDRQFATGHYTAHHMKSFGLADEIDSFVPLIKKKQISRLNLKCSAL